MGENMAVGKRLRDIRKKLNLTQGDFAKKVNVSSQVISNWEREYTKPNSEDIERIANNLNINPNFLYGLTDDPTIKGTQSEIYNTYKKEDESPIPSEVKAWLRADTSGLTVEEQEALSEELKDFFESRKRTLLRKKNRE
jgi:transcriptional regulator with XRE-family HTH domain